MNFSSRVRRFKKRATLNINACGGAAAQGKRSCHDSCCAHPTSLVGIQHDARARAPGPAEDTELDRVARRAAFQREKEVVIGGDRLSFNLHDDVAQLDSTVAATARRLDAGAIGTAAGLNRDDEGAFDTEAPAHLGARELDAESGPSELAVLYELRHDPFDSVDRDRETDAGVCPGRAVDRGVDADQAAARVEQRPTRVPGIDRRVGLYDIANRDLRDRLDLA